ncbi:MAG: hypothetical protein HOH33_05285 [Verrucomicrobia bacterium]|nr:hypothetical protein [Verrucomicrobiota bacterium]
MSHQPHNLEIWADVKKSLWKFVKWLPGAFLKIFFAGMLMSVGVAFAVGAVLNLISGFRNEGVDALFSFVLAIILGLFSWWVGWKKGYGLLSGATDWQRIYDVPVSGSIQQLKNILQIGGMEAVAQYPFPEHWKETLFSHSALYRRIPDELKDRLHRFTKYFLTEVEFNGGLVGDFGEDEMVLVAGEACVLILGRDYWDYRKLSLVELRKFPILDNEEFTLPWEPNAHYAGHATINTVRLHWDTALVQANEGASGNNLILHEFAHIMDSADDGKCQSILGRTGSEEARQWEALLEEEFPKLVAAHKRGEDHVLPPYAISVDPAHITIRGIKKQRPEFFSCATEVFFEKSERLQNECPKIYEAMKGFYKLDPVSWSNLQDA